ncbi:SRPBCC family protein [Fictibacillus sp. FJAT-27399]|uniref:SRPBCC family protein n=1 Tax=Fictibacillus sp. FJAT-27399 TaxID=1729689 RepID=UPI000781EFF2|nr:SRPBCC family protein [Fictibacillus sp. FJAT-27399]
MSKPTENLRKEIWIDCSPSTLFTFFTDPDKMNRWMGRHVLLEPKIGGKYWIDINGENVATGEYKELIPNEKVVLTWGWKDSEVMPPGSTTVEFLLKPQYQGTLLILNHYDIPVEKVPTNQKGWTHYIDRIKHLGEGNDLGADPWSVQGK